MLRDRLSDPTQPIALIPVSFFWGRGPGRTNSLWKLLFSESWKKPSAIKKGLRVLWHGRDCAISFGQQFSLDKSAITTAKHHGNHGIDTASTVALPEKARSRLCRRLFRLCRLHFRHERTAAIGPDLSHRRQMPHQVLSDPQVRQTIKTLAEQQGIAPQKLKKQAHRYVMEIASDYAHSMVRAYHLLLTKLWHQLYDGLAVHGLDRVQTVAGTHTLIYVPCHRSHMDYLLLPYVLYNAGLAPPHTAAGINLNLPLIGRLLRHGGAFFLRRQFKGDPLYTSVFQSYLAVMLSQGTSLAFFIEGGRSRSGRLLPPKLGMVNMILQNYVTLLPSANARSLAFIPVYIGYEKLFEGNTYLKELSGIKKQPESITGLLRALRGLRNRFGKVHIQFGQPILPAEQLGATTQADSPCAGTQFANQTKESEQHRTHVQRVGQEITAHINDAAIIADINMVSLALLAAPNHALDETVLEKQLSFYQKLLADKHASTNGHIPWIMSQRSPTEMISSAEKLSLVRRQTLFQGDLILAEPNKALLMTYFRNNCVHTLALHALLACALHALGQTKRVHLMTLVTTIMPMLCEELSVSYDAKRCAQSTQGTLDHFSQAGLLTATLQDASSTLNDSTVFRAAAGSTAEALTLKLLGQIIRPSLERYLVTLTVIRQLNQHQMGPENSIQGTAEKSRLVTLIQESFQRLAVLAEFNAPEFFEQKLVETLLTGAEKLHWLAWVPAETPTHPDPESNHHKTQNTHIALTENGEAAYQQLRPIVGSALLPLLNL
jgi:glycerol-3-phosphate O-acyltransferase